MSILPQSEIYTTLWNLRKFKTGQHFLKGVTYILQCRQHSRGRVRLCSKHGRHNGMPVARMEGCCPVEHGWDNHFTQTCLNEDEDCNNGAVSVKSPHAINRPRLQKRIWMFLGNPRRSVTIEMAGHMQPTYGKVQGEKKSRARSWEHRLGNMPPSLSLLFLQLSWKLYRG